MQRVTRQRLTAKNYPNPRKKRNPYATTTCAHFSPLATPFFATNPKPAQKRKPLSSNTLRAQIRLLSGPKHAWNKSPRPSAAAAKSEHTMSAKTLALRTAPRLPNRSSPDRTCSARRSTRTRTTTPTTTGTTRRTTGSSTRTTGRGSRSPRPTRTARSAGSRSTSSGGCFTTGSKRSARGSMGRCGGSPAHTG